MIKKRYVLVLLLLVLCIGISSKAYAAVSDAEAEGKENSWRYQDGKLMENESESQSSGIHTYSVGEYSVLGIDVSYHNGTINWATVADNVDFVILRCGYGQNYTSQDDKAWKTNADACTKYKIPFGVYLYSYATSTAKASSEADHVLRLIQGYKLDYPVYYDMEDDSVRTTCSNSVIADTAKTFCAKIQAAGYDVGVYANKYWWTTYLTDSCFDNWTKWVAQYASNCTYGGSYDMWQYSEYGNVPGITGGYVDMNCLVGAIDIDTTDITLETQNYTYDGNAKTPLVTIPGLTKSVDYTIAYSNNTAVGTATVTVTGMGSYKGIAERKFTIKNPVAEKKKISSMTATLSTSSYTYTGNAKKPSVTIAGLTKNTDYTVAYSNNVNPGYGTVTITGKGNYTGTLKKQFTIKPAKITNITVSSRTSSSIKLSWNPQSDITAYRIYHYDTKTKAYKSVKSLTASKGNTYTVTGLASGTAHQFKIRSYYTETDGTKIFGSYSSILNNITIPAKVSISKISSLSTVKGKITLSWQKTAATGYQIQYSLKSDFSSGVNSLLIVDNDTTAWSIKSLPGKKTYYMRVRAYKTYNGVKYYGSFSTVKSKYCY